MPHRIPIVVLSEETILKIAAGEVIERPASIVKELMENAIDAFATTIDVHIHQGGLGQITVKDNGIGFTSTDLPLSIVKNATSKIKTDQDLQSITSQGFRGEALSSISSVSNFEITTKAKEESEGFELTCSGAQNPTIKPSPSHDGTKVSVKNLFFNTPARKKFLKTQTTEFHHIEKTFKKIVLCHPEIEFKLFKENKMVFHLPQRENFENRIQDLYPQEVTQTLVDFHTTQGPISVFGLTSNAHQKTSTDQVWIFVNGRWISDRALKKAIMQGYRTALMEHQSPVTFLYIQMPPDQLDINVHPTKSEVRFQDAQTLFRIVQRTIASTLQTQVAKHRIRFTPKPNHFSPTQTEIQRVTRFIQQDSTSQATNIQTPPTTITQDRGFFGQLTYLSALDGTYLICKSHQELILIDQHAAHERVLFEKLKNQFQNQSQLSQRTLMPETLSLDAAQIKKLEKHKQPLLTLGFDWEPFGENEIIVRSLPSMIKNVDTYTFVQSLLAEIDLDDDLSWLENKIDHVLSTMACHSAVRAHDRLTDAEIDQLLLDMDQTSYSSYCPHGRPTFLKMNLEDLEKLFARTV